MNGVRRVIRTRSRDDGNGHCPNDSFKQFETLRVGKHRRFTGGTRNYKTIIAIVLQPFG